MQPSSLRHLTLLALAACPAILSAAEPCRITVIDAENGWPVPMVELTTTHHVSFFTDNAGVVAFDLPESMGKDTWLTVAADGYEVAPDGFGYRGHRFTPQPGGKETIEVTRTIVAKRLGRLTGGGIFSESQKLGEQKDWNESGIFGSDSVLNAVYRGKMFWAWGDTIMPHYPLGLFHTTSATTAIQPLQKFEPPLKLALDYFRDEKDKVRNVCNIAPNDPGPTWVSGYVSLKDVQGSEHLVGCYTKIEAPMNAYRIGLCVWNDETSNFESVEVLWDKSEGGKAPELLPMGHPSFWKDEKGVEWLLLGDPFPTVRMPATYESWRDRTRWEAIDAPGTLHDAEGTKIEPHRGSIAWNEGPQRWVTIFGEKGGKPSFLGEIWYAEAESPFGPWGTAVKVLSHRELTFYNPRIHPEMTPPDSPVLLFEGTYTQSFSAATAHTPRYDYNQILYRLDLDDPALAPARGQ
jgi:hypothetical protein